MVLLWKGPHRRILSSGSIKGRIKVPTHETLISPDLGQPHICHSSGEIQRGHALTSAALMGSRARLENQSCYWCRSVPSTEAGSRSHTTNLHSKSDPPHTFGAVGSRCSPVNVYVFFPRMIKNITHVTSCSTCYHCQFKTCGWTVVLFLQPGSLLQ